MASKTAASYVTVPVVALQTLRGIPKLLDVSLHPHSRVSNLRGRLSELTGDHRSVAGLAYKGRAITNDNDMLSLSDFLFRKERAAQDEEPRVIVFDQIEGTKCPFHFFPTSDGKTLTIDDRKDPRAKITDASLLIQKGINFNRNMLSKELKQYREPEWPELSTCKSSVGSRVWDASEASRKSGVALKETASVDLALNVAVHKFYNLLGTERVPNLCVIGGVHGNEASGIRGAHSVLNFLQKGEHWLAKEILRLSSVTVIPCINSVGQLANARSSPMLGTMVLKDEQGKVYVGEHQHGGMFPPVGWQDPNRGWVQNKTLVKRILEKSLFDKDVQRPDLIIFNHDWAVPNGALMARGIHEKELWAGAKELFARHYPSRTGYGKPYDHLIDLPVPAKDKWVNGEPECLTSCLVEHFQTPNYTIETYCGRQSDYLLHFEVTLFLLAKHCGIGESDAHLRDLVLQCSGALI